MTPPPPVSGLLVTTAMQLLISFAFLLSSRHRSSVIGHCSAAAYRRGWAARCGIFSVGQGGDRSDVLSETSYHSVGALSVISGHKHSLHFALPCVHGRHHIFGCMVDMMMMSACFLVFFVPDCSFRPDDTSDVDIAMTYHK